MIKGYLEYITNGIDSYLSSKRNNFLLTNDFNSEPIEEAVENFSQINNFKKLLDNLTWYKTLVVPHMSICS